MFVVLTANAVIYLLFGGDANTNMVSVGLGK